VPEADETYAEDSFVVGSEEEEEESGEEDAEDIELMPEESYVEGRRQYATRRRVFLHRARVGRAGAETPAAEQRAGAKTKRVVRRDDSSEEETEGVGEKRRLTAEADVAVPLWPKGAQQQKPSSSSSSSSSTGASTVSLLSKAQRISVREDQQKER